MIDLHYVATANGLKVVIALEEMGMPYNVLDYPLFEGKHLTREFRKLNPNNKLPVIVYSEPACGGGVATGVRDRGDPDVSGGKERPLPARR